MFSVYTKKATLVCMAFIAFIFSFGFLLKALSSTQTMASPYNLTIVLDAGHGGRDVKQRLSNILTFSKIIAIYLKLGYIVFVCSQ